MLLLFPYPRSQEDPLPEPGSEPVFLRDGRRIAFQDGNVLRIVDTGSGRTREILSGDDRRVSRREARRPGPPGEGCCCFRLVRLAPAGQTPPLGGVS